MGRPKERSEEQAKERRRFQQRAHYQRRREALRAIKEGQVCQKCGYDDVRALGFHHRDPSTKRFSIGAKHWILSWQDVLDEIAKCDLLCANCHAIEHHEDKASGYAPQVSADPDQLTLEDWL